jgi:pimeloyl-ACP methyl ester carboxylesterase
MTAAQLAARRAAASLLAPGMCHAQGRAPCIRWRVDANTTVRAYIWPHSPHGRHRTLSNPAVIASGLASNRRRAAAAGCRQAALAQHALDVRLAVHDYGSRDAAHTVVLLHGLCLTAQSWHAPIRGLIRTWGDSVRIISYDHRGHGESDGAPMSTCRIDQLAADLTDVLIDLNVGGLVTLVGHSMGGMTALTCSRPVQPHGLVLVAAAAGRLAAARARAAANAEADRIAALGDLDAYELPQHLRQAAQVRRGHRDLNYSQAGAVLGISKDVFTGRIRRFWRAIDTAGQIA